MKWEFIRNRSRNGKKPDFFFYTYDSILKKLGKDKEYKEQKKELDESEKAFTIINVLCEGKEVTTGATKEEMEMVQKYMKLKFEMKNQVEGEHYLRGYRDCILFFGSFWILIIKGSFF